VLCDVRRRIVRQFQQKRLAGAVSDIYAQLAVLSRVTDHLAEHGLEPSGQERYIAQAGGRPRAAGA
jgi:acyl-CoA dehydrogenase family member 9